MVVGFVALEQCIHHHCHSLQVCLLPERQEPTRKGEPANTKKIMWWKFWFLLGQKRSYIGKNEILVLINKKEFAAVAQGKAYSY